MAVARTPSANPDQSTELIQDLIQGGVCVSALTFGAPIVAFAAPQDDDRQYIAFSLNPGGKSAVVIPGDTAAPFGFTLSPESPNLEFGGNVMACLVKARWLLQSDLGNTVTIVAIRQPC